jgi:hypothetical protein
VIIVALFCPTSDRIPKPGEILAGSYAVESAMRVGALDRKGREQQVRHCLRPAIANARWSIRQDGSVAYATKHLPRTHTPSSAPRPTDHHAVCTCPTFAEDAQVFFPMAGGNEGWARRAENLKAEIDQERIDAYRGTVSLPLRRTRTGASPSRSWITGGSRAMKVMEVEA